MPFQKGHPLYGGIKKGQKHKIPRDVAAMLNELNCNPLEGLAAIANDPKTPGALRAHCHATLAKYVHPQLQSIQHTGPGGGPIQTEDVSARELLRSRVVELTTSKDPGTGTE